MKPRKKRKSSQNNIPFIAASLIVGAACGLMIASVCFDDDLSFGQFMIRLGIGIIVMYLAAIVQIIIHEGGHLLFGLMSGYKFVSFRVLSFMLVRVDGKMQFKRMSIAGTGGQCLLDPPDMVDGHLPYVAYNLGGVILNLVTAAIFGAIAPALRGHDLAFLVFRMLAVIGVAFAVLNGLPIASAMSNDGNNARARKGSGGAALVLAANENKRPVMQGRQTARYAERVVRAFSGCRPRERHGRGRGRTA